MLCVRPSALSSHTIVWCGLILVRTAVQAVRRRFSIKRQTDGAGATMSARSAQPESMQTGAVKRERTHSSPKTRSSPNARTDRGARELKRLAGKRDEMIGVVYELYGRCN